MLTKLQKYANNIKSVIKITNLKGSSIIPHIEQQNFKFISISYDHRMLFHISTSGTDLTHKGAMEYSHELEKAAEICRELNKCYLEDRDAHIIAQLAHI